MIPIKDPKDRQFFRTLLAYVEAGGKIEHIMQMLEFIRKYQIDLPVFLEVMKKDKEAIMQKLRDAKLIS